MASHRTVCVTGKWFYRAGREDRIRRLRRATIDLQQLRELFGNTIRATNILAIDEDLRDEMLEKRPRIAPNLIAPDGVLQEWLKPYEGKGANPPSLLSSLRSLSLL